MQFCFEILFFATPRPRVASHFYSKISVYSKFRVGRGREARKKKKLTHAVILRSQTRGGFQKKKVKKSWGKRKRHFLNSSRNHIAPFFLFVVTLPRMWLCFLFFDLLGEVWNTENKNPHKKKVSLARPWHVPSRAIIALTPPRSPPRCMPSLFYREKGATVSSLGDSRTSCTRQSTFGGSVYVDQNETFAMYDNRILIGKSLQQYILI